MKIEVTEREVAMICDALYTAATRYRMDRYSNYPSGTADRYDALALRLGSAIAGRPGSQESEAPRCP